MDPRVRDPGQGTELDYKKLLDELRKSMAAHEAKQRKEFAALDKETADYLSWGPHILIFSDAVLSGLKFKQPPSQRQLARLCRRLGPVTCDALATVSAKVLPDEPVDMGIPRWRVPRSRGPFPDTLRGDVFVPKLVAAIYQGSDVAIEIPPEVVAAIQGTVLAPDASLRLCLVAPRSRDRDNSDMVIPRLGLRALQHLKMHRGPDDTHGNVPHPRGPHPKRRRGPEANVPHPRGPPT